MNEQTDLLAGLSPDLEEYEAQRETSEAAGIAENPLTAADWDEAQRLMRRYKYHIVRPAQIRATYERAMEPYRREIERLTERMEEAIEPHVRRAEWYKAPLEAFARLEVGNRKKDKTVRLPDGDLSVSDQQDEVNYGDEKKLTAILVKHNIIALYRNKPEPNKKAIKETVFFQDGKAYVPDMDGMAIEVPITKTPRPPKVTITVAE